MIDRAPGVCRGSALDGGGLAAHGALGSPAAQAVHRLCCGSCYGILFRGQRASWLSLDRHH